MATFVIDIETENTGADVMADNKRIISVQIGDSTSQELYYADARNPSLSTSQVPQRIRTLIAEGNVLAGYNLKGFDLQFLKKFLGVEIPEVNVLEIGEMDGVKKLKQRTGKRFYKLEELCKEYGIPADHKRQMDERAGPFKRTSEVQALAENAARKLVEEEGWTFNFALEKKLGTISIGRAIYDSYLEYVQKDGAKETLFHRYAVGDVICEHQLMQRLLKD
jgi:DNA polymerase III epsilon subunit-like protein